MGDQGEAVTIDFDSALVWFDCTHCRGNFGQFPGGFCENCQNSGGWPFDVSTLFANLAVAGALCAAFRHGFDEGWAVTSEGFNAEHVGQRWKANQREYYELMAAPGWGEGWRPGCGRNAGGGR